MLKRIVLLLFIFYPSLILPMCPPNCVFNKVPGSPFGSTVLNSPISVAFSPNNTCLAVASQAGGPDLNGYISMFILNSDCTLTSQGSFSNEFFVTPSSVAFSPINNCLAIANVGTASNLGGVATTSVDFSNCFLASSANNIATNLRPDSVAFSPVPCNSNNLLAAANGLLNAISLFNIDYTNCTLTLISNLPTNQESTFTSSTAFSPNGDCIVATNANINPAETNSTITVFKINSDCSTASSTTYTSGVNPASAAFSPFLCKGNYLLAVANSGDNTVSIFSSNPSTCDLSNLIKYPTGQSPVSVVFSPSGSCLAVANFESNSVSIYSVNTSTCELSLLANYPTGRLPASLAFSPSGSCLAVANSFDNTITMFSTGFKFDLTNAVLNCNDTVTITGIANPSNFITIYEGSTPVSSTVTAGSPSGSFTITTNPLSAGTHTLTLRSANFAVPTCFEDFSLGNFNIASSVSLPCQLTSATSISAGGIAPNSIAFSPTHNCVAAANLTSNTVSLFTINPANCTLTAVAGSPFAATNPVATAFSPNGNCFVVANSVSVPTGTVTIYPVNSSCQLGSAIIQNTGGLFPSAVGFSPSGNCFAVTNHGSNNISTYSVNPNCTVNFVNTFATGAGPSSLAFSPTGNCVAVANSTDNTISMFSINPVSCSLTPVPGSPFSSGGTDPIFVAFSPSGSCLAVANQSSNSVSMFTVNSNCSLTAAGSPFTTLINTPKFLAFSPSESCLAVANDTSNGSITIASVNSNCTLSFNQNIAAGPNTNSVAFSPSGTCVAATNGNNDILTFSVTAAPVSISLFTSPVIIPCPENLTDITAIFGCGTGTFTQATIFNGISTITIPNPSNPLVYPVFSNTTNYTFTVTDSSHATASASIVA